MIEPARAEIEVGNYEARIRPFRVSVKFAERVWGRTDLRPWFEATGTSEKVGEAWLTGPECVVETGSDAGKTLAEMAKIYPGQLGNGEFPLLVKVLFPSEKLSVQVHPNDEQAQAAGLARGKTECWYVLEAEPGATVACGLQPGVGAEDVRDAAKDGTMEELLVQVPVKVGEMIFVDAGTVHAIGPGVVLLEVQQTCDVTYRLFDYGRGRDLHLEEGLKVIKATSESGKVESIPAERFTRLIGEKYFVVDRFDLPANTAIEMEMDGTGCVAGIAGAAAVNEVRFGVGQAVVVPMGSVTVTSEHGCSFVRCWEPGK